MNNAMYSLSKKNMQKMRGSKGSVVPQFYSGSQDKQTRPFSVMFHGVKTGCNDQDRFMSNDENPPR